MRLIIFAVSRDFWMLAVGQGIGAMREGAGAGQPVVSGFIADRTTRQSRGQVFSTLAIISGLSGAVGSLFAGLPAIFQSTLYLDGVSAHAMLFWLGAIVSSVSVVLLLPIRDVERQVEVRSEESVDASPRNWGVIAKFSLVRGTSGVGWGFMQSLMSLYFFTRFGVGGEVLGPISSLTRFLSVLSYTRAPAIVKRWGQVRPLIATRAISAALAIALALTPWFYPAIVLLVALRVAIMCTAPIRQTFTAGIFGSRDVATGVGISSFARMGLRTVAPTVAGFMFEAISPTMPFVSGAIFLVGNAFLYKTWFQPKGEPERASAGAERAIESAQ